MGACSSHSAPHCPLKEDDSDLLQKVHAELRQANWQHRPEPQPALLCDWGLYLGGLAEASNAQLMKDLGIGAIVNTASSMCIYTPRGEVAPREMRLLQFDAHDCDYPLLEKHFAEFEHFVSHSKAYNTKTLVHCQAGMNRSAGLCAAYLVYKERIPLVKAIRLMVEKRGLVLTNPSFVKQPVHLAHTEHLLE
ncbi:Dual specificity protein phosphatase 1 (AtDsPTP1) [Durusdinium trenchii]|uniref:protein-tyrosine-phosphatase n=1 Tax=Durusdinium trenchii TaxID=1381693 RepID=A0ABP0Q847_9DINO